MSLYQRIERIETVLGLTPGEPIDITAPVPAGAMCEAFAIRRVALEVCREMNMPFEAVMTADRRDKAFFPARAAISWLARERLQRSYAAIGETMGKMDHSSIAYQVERAKVMLTDSRQFHAAVDLVSRRLFGRAVA